MQNSEGEMTFYLLLLMVAGSIGIVFFLKNRKAIERRLRLENREELNVDLLVSEITEGSDVNKSTAKQELIALSNTLSLPVGFLRPEDIVEELIGQDYFTGDAVFEIEKKLQLLPNHEFHKPTVRQVILALSQIGPKGTRNI